MESRFSGVEESSRVILLPGEARRVRLTSTEKRPGVTAWLQISVRAEFKTRRSASTLEEPTTVKRRATAWVDWGEVMMKSGVGTARWKYFSKKLGWK